MNPIWLSNNNMFTGSISATALSSNVVDVSLGHSVCLQVNVYSGTLAGTVILLGSNDGQNYATIPNSTITLAGSVGNQILPYIPLSCRYISAQIVRTAGTSTVDVYVSVKA